MEITIKQIHLLDNRESFKLDCLIEKCDGYEPFSLCANEAESGFYCYPIIQFAAYNAADEMIGFLSCIQDDTVPEVTALVDPDMRRQGIFSSMLKELKTQLKPSHKPVCSIAPKLYSKIKNSSLNLEAAYTEYLMKLEARNKPDANTVSDDINSSYEFYFSEDDTEYLMYEAGALEPVVVCTLDYQPSFTNVAGVFVDEEHRHNGLGFIFMNSLINDYFSSESNPLVLNVTSTNIPALKLYRKCGFAVACEVNYYYL